MSNPPAYTPTIDQTPSNIASPKTQIHMQPPPELQFHPSTVRPPMQPPSIPEHGMPPPQTLSVGQAGEQYRAQLFSQCAQGIHDPHTKYGVCGIITAVVCFPIGLICLFIDTEQRCHRCGVRLDQ